jgi:hypothetical protein
LSWQAKQSILHTTVTFYGYCVKMCEDFSSNFGYKLTGCCFTTRHSLTFLFPPGIFWPKNNMTVVTHSSYFPVSPAKDKTERPLFWHNWGDLGTIAGGAEHPHRTRLPVSIYRMAERLGTVHTTHGNGTTSRVMVTSRPKVSLWPEGSSSPGNYGCLFV